MRHLILLALVLSTTLVSASECMIREYRDHIEAECRGGPAATPPASTAVDHSIQERGPARDETFSALPAAPGEGNDDGEIRTVRSDLGRRHAQQWVATTPPM
jgi:hypothetical protein